MYHFQVHGPLTWPIYVTDKSPSRPTGPGEGWEADTKMLDLVEPKVAPPMKVNSSDSDIGAAEGTDLMEPTSPVQPVPAKSLEAPASPSSSCTSGTEDSSDDVLDLLGEKRKFAKEAKFSIY